jgi:hypothetical protein
LEMCSARLAWLAMPASRRSFRSGNASGVARRCSRSARGQHDRRDGEGILADRNQVHGAGLEHERLPALECAPRAAELDDAADRDDRDRAVVTPGGLDRERSGRPRSSHSQVRASRASGRSARRSGVELGRRGHPASWRENSSSAAATSALSCSDGGGRSSAARPTRGRRDPRGGAGARR